MLFSGLTNAIGPEDIFSQVMGPERSGRIRIYGRGVASVDIWGEVPTRGTQHLIMADQKEKILRLEEQVKEQADLIREQTTMLVEIRATLP
jgi:hypothetical protein